MTFFSARQTLFFPFGSNQPIFQNALDWTVRRSAKECWAVSGPNASLFLATTLLGRARVDPPSSRAWPFLDDGNARPLDDRIRRVSFATRLSGNSGSDFTDYTARYGALQEEDKLLLRQHFQQHVELQGIRLNADEIDAVADKFGLANLLHMPLIALSNGQTRRARLARAFLSKPDLLILEEPLTGLDVSSRQNMMDSLGEMHQLAQPSLIFSLRTQDGLPSFITHAVQLTEDKSGTRRIESVGAITAKHFQPAAVSESRHITVSESASMARPLIELKEVTVHGRTPVLVDVDWTVRQGERWRLKGPNGSGKSTLLALVTGDHPQSFCQPGLNLFGRPRSDSATVLLQHNIGHVSPEIFNAFPRKFSPGAMTAYDAIASGFENVFTYRRLTDPEQIKAIQTLVQRFGIGSSILNALFAELEPSHQSLVLFLRALVKRPPLLLLDEPFAGMSAGMVERCKDHIDNELDTNQAVIMISHYDDEVPRSIDKTLELRESKDLKALSAVAPERQDLEEALAQLLTSLSTLTDCVLNVDPAAFQDQTNLPGGIVGHTMSQIVHQLADLQKCAPALDKTLIPLEAVNYVDAGKNPNLHTKNHVERTALENQYTNGMLSAMTEYQADLRAQLKNAFPAIADDIA